MPNPQVDTYIEAHSLRKVIEHQEQLIVAMERRGETVDQQLLDRLESNREEYASLMDELRH